MIARTTLGRGLAVALSLALSQAATPAAQAATAHLVDSQKVMARLADQAATRAERLRLVQEVLATPEAQRQAKAMGVDLERMKAAVPHLSDAELADLAKRAASAKDVVAGHGGDEGLVLLALILLLAGLAILVAVSDYDDYWDDCYCW